MDSRRLATGLIFILALPLLTIPHHQASVGNLSVWIVTSEGSQSNSSGGCDSVDGRVIRTISRHQIGVTFCEDSTEAGQILLVPVLFDSSIGDVISYAGGELILDEQEIGEWAMVQIMIADSPGESGGD